MGQDQVTPGVTLSNVTPLDIFSLDSYFTKPTVGLINLYVFIMHAKFHVNQMLFTI